MPTKIIGGGGGGSGGLVQPFHLASPTILPAGSEAWYPAADNNGLTTFVASVNFLRSVPFVVRRTGSIDRVGFSLFANGAAGSLSRIGIYAAAAAAPFNPTALLFDSGSIATDAGAPLFVKAVIAPSLKVTFGQLLWPTLLCGVNPPTINSNTAAAPHPYYFGYSGGPARQGAIFEAFAFAALPAVYPGPIGGFIADASEPWLVIRYDT